MVASRAKRAERKMGDLRFMASFLVGLLLYHNKNHMWAFDGSKFRRTLRKVVRIYDREDTTPYNSSAALKKTGISTAAVSGASDPCTQLRSMLSANRFRMVPSAAFAGLVAPIVSRHFLIASGASSTITTT